VKRRSALTDSTVTTNYIMPRTSLAKEEKLRKRTKKLCPFFMYACHQCHAPYIVHGRAWEIVLKINVQKTQPHNIVGRMSIFSDMSKRYLVAECRWPVDLEALWPPPPPPPKFKSLKNVRTDWLLRQIQFN
jgi:hypothetical protein